jgi:molybdopterin-guanine dinucleotide biosynthesis protein B
MRPIISVVGRSDSGKTTVLEKLIPELTRRGYRVAAIKRSVHGFEIDHPGKDSFRLAKAGAKTVLIVSPDKLALVKQLDQELDVFEVAGTIDSDVDLILTEGFKRSPTQKIEVARAQTGLKLLCQKEELLAIVSDSPIEIDVPQFGFDEVDKLVDLLEEKVMVKGKM